MKKIAILAGMSVLAAGTANAEGFYVGGTFGVSDVSLDVDTTFGEPDDRLYMTKAVGGYRVSDFFAVEGSLFGASNDDFDDSFDGDVDVSFGAITTAFVGIIPATESFHLYGKVGGYIGESDVGDSFLFIGSGNEEDEEGLHWGAGAYINFGNRQQFTIRLDYEEFDTDAFEDFWTVSAGFQYNF